jgi:hypothetical protein
LVMERSTVQSCLAAPFFPTISTLVGNPVAGLTRRFGICTQNKARSGAQRRAKSVQSVRLLF